MKIFITGGEGQIGTHLKEFFSHQNDMKIMTYDLINNEDILDYPLLLSKMRNFYPDIVIHLAAMSNITDCNNNPEKSLQVNGNGSGNVIRAAIQCTNVKKIIYSSTASVYGDLVNQEKCDTDLSVLSFNENSPLNPDSIYGHSKLLGEKILESYCQKNTDIFGISNENKFKGELIILRLFNVVMNNKNLDRLFAALQKPNFTIYGNDYQTPDGTCIRDYISINDVCCAIGHLLIIKSNGIYNVCTGKGTSVLEIAKLCGIDVKYGPRRKGDINVSIGNNNRLMGTIGNDDNNTFEIKDSIESIINGFFGQKIGNIF